MGWQVHLGNPCVWFRRSNGRDGEECNAKFRLALLARLQRQSIRSRDATAIVPHLDVWFLVSVAAACGLAFLATPAYADGVTETGAFQTSIPITVPAYHGIEPSLSLSYRSDASDGWIGVGWSLSGASSIVRASPGRGVPRYDDQDTFFLDGAELLQCVTDTISPSCEPEARTYPSSSEYTAFTTRVESFHRIAYDPRNSRWFVWDGAGTKSTYDVDLSTPGGSFSWHISALEDSVGNRLQFSYWYDTADPSEDPPYASPGYLKEIRYGVGGDADSIITFYSEINQDTVTFAVGSELARIRYRLRTIGIVAGGGRLSAYALKYSQPDPGPSHSLLAAVQEYGRDVLLDTSGGVIAGTALPAIKFQRQEGQPVGQFGQAHMGPDPTWGPQGPDTVGDSVFSGRSVLVPQVYQGSFNAGDFDGDGRTDWLVLSTCGDADHPGLQFTTSLAGQFASAPQPISCLTLPISERNPNKYSTIRAWTPIVADVNGDGLTDVILVASDLTFDYQFDTPHKVSLGVALSNGDGTFRWAPSSANGFQQTSWIDYDNQLDPVHSGELRIRCAPGDVNGDGRTDLVCTSQDESMNHFLGTALSQGDGSFDLLTIPSPVHSTDHVAPEGIQKGSDQRTPTRHLVVADTNGDGKADLLVLDYHCTVDVSTAAPFCGRVSDLLTALSTADGYYSFNTQTTDWQGYGQLYSMDMDGDGTADYLVISGPSDGGPAPGVIETGRAQVDGTFALHKQAAPAELVAPGSRITIGDIDGDGKNDLLVVSKRGDQPGQGCPGGSTPDDTRLTRLLSKGGGEFDIPAAWGECPGSKVVGVPWSSVLTRFQGESVAADTNGDGLADFLLAYTSGQSGGLTRVTLDDDVSVTTGLDTHRWMPADVTGTGRDSLVYITHAHDQAGFDGTEVYTLVATSDAYSQVVQRLSLPADQLVASNWRIMDANGDGKADLVYLEYFETWGLGPGGSATLGDRGLRIHSYLARGDGHWDEPPAFVIHGVGEHDTPRWLSADVEGYGAADLVHIGGIGRNVGIETLLSNKDGTWRFQRIDQGSGFLEPTLNWRVADVNGDGKADLVQVIYTKFGANPPIPFLSVRTLFSEGDGYWRGVSGHYMDLPWNAESGDAANWRVLDSNGDGKTDLVHISYYNFGPTGTLDQQDINLGTLLSNGDGTWTAVSRSSNLPGTAGNWWPAHNLQAADVKGDGRGNLVHFQYSSSGVRIDTLQFGFDGQWIATAPDTKAAADAQETPNGLRWQLSNASGDGRAAFVRVDRYPGGLFAKTLVSSATFDSVSRISGGAGGETTVSYSPSSAWRESPADHSQVCHLPWGVALRAVKETNTYDGRTPAGTLTIFSYGCPRWSDRDRTMLAWREVTTRSEALPSLPPSQTTTTYEALDAQGIVRPIDIIFKDVSVSDAPHTGPSSEVVTHYEFTRGVPPFISLVHDQVQRTCSSDLDCTTQSRTFTYDQDPRTTFTFGNLTLVDEVGDGVQERVTTRVFHPNLTAFILALPAEEQVSAPSARGQSVAHLTRYCYDGDQLETCDTSPVRGMLTAVRRWDDQNNQFYSQTWAYDAWGNPTLSIDANSHTTQTQYDTTYHLYPLSTCNALLQCTTTPDWDYVFGQPKRTIDPNGQQIAYDYDPFGRLISTIEQMEPDRQHDRKELRRYLDAGVPDDIVRDDPPASVRLARLRIWLDDGSPDGLWTKTYLDGLGRAYRVATKGAAAGSIYASDAVFAGSSSLVARESRWYDLSDPSTAVYDDFGYDAASRLVRETHADGTHRDWQYGVWPGGTSTTSLDELGHGRTLFTDHRGLARVVREVTPEQVADTKYEYDVLGRLTSVTDAAGNMTNIRWDSLGRKLSESDPDRGHWSYDEYDNVGNLKRMTDAAGTQTALAYDALDRVTSKAVGTKGQTTSWRYDEPGHGASLGRLTSVEDPTGASCSGGISDAYTYDLSGAVAVGSKCVLGTSFQMGFGRDALGRLASVTYPSDGGATGGEVVTYGYDPAGRLSTLSGYVLSMEYTPEGRVRQATFANGTTEHYQYDPNRSWLKEATVESAGIELYQASYENYWPNGLIHTVTSRTNKTNLTFTYDALNRLTATAGDFPQQLQYDTLGNICHNSLVGDYTYAYAPYPGGCSGTGGQGGAIRGAHTLIRAGDRSYTYDPNGNVKSRGSSEIRWNAENQPEWIQDEGGAWTRYLYDAGGARVYTWHQNEVQHTYFGPFADYSSETGLTKHYYMGSQLIASRSIKGVQWYHLDALGSVRLVTDESGAPLQRLDYNALGQSIPSMATHAEDFGFAGHRTEDRAGLIYMNARYYDPQLGRFLSPDSFVPDPLNPQGLNLYTYAYNDPANLVDRTGHQATGVSGSGQGPEPSPGWGWPEPGGPQPSQPPPATGSWQFALRPSRAPEAPPPSIWPSVWAGLRSAARTSLPRAAFALALLWPSDTIASGDYERRALERYRASERPQPIAEPNATMPLQLPAAGPGGDPWELPSGSDPIAQADPLLQPAAIRERNDTFVPMVAGQDHHLATINNTEWTPVFRELFIKAGIAPRSSRGDPLNNRLNVVNLRWHRSKHPDEYHTYIYFRLAAALDQGAGTFQETLEELRGEVRSNQRMLKRGGDFWETTLELKP